MFTPPQNIPAAGGPEPRLPKRGSARAAAGLDSEFLPNMEVREVITVQGLSGSGKTTLGKELAKRIGWVHFSSGLLYRSAAFLVREAGIPMADEHRVTAAVTRAFTPEGFRRGQETFAFKLKVVETDGLKKIHLFLDRRADGRTPGKPKDITEALHKDESIAGTASDIAGYRSLRQFFRGVQLRGLPCSNLVVDGRDSHKVFRKAAILKFWVAADPAVRASRAVIGKGIVPGSPTFQTEFDIAKGRLGIRDNKDRNRAVDPATRPKRGFITVPNNDESLAPALDLMLSKTEPMLKE